MKKLALGVTTAVAISFSIPALAAKPGTDDGPYDPTFVFNGNGAPSGPHYNLNLIGMEVEKNADAGDTKGQGHRIFVKLNGKTDIYLKEGAVQDKFAVIDYDGTDGRAEFELPSPDPTCSEVTEYSVFIRALTPHGDATMRSCAETIDTSDGSTDRWCSIGEFEVNLSKNGRERFENVSRQLLYVTIIDPNNGKLTRVPLFADGAEDYLWEYDNNGLRLTQMRFYPTGTDVSGDSVEECSTTFPDMYAE